MGHGMPGKSWNYLNYKIFHFLSLESHEINVWVMESREKVISILSEIKNAKRSKVEKIRDKLENWF